MPKAGLLIFPFWTPHFVTWTSDFGWNPRLNYTGSCIRCCHSCCTHYLSLAVLSLSASTATSPAVIDWQAIGHSTVMSVMLASQNISRFQRYTLIFG